MQERLLLPGGTLEEHRAGGRTKQRQSTTAAHRTEKYTEGDEAHKHNMSERKVHM
jgi:hypothetical protein